MDGLTEARIYISFWFSEEYTEVQLDDQESVEVALEDPLSQVLVELFGEPIVMDDVKVKYSLPAKA